MIPEGEGGPSLEEMGIDESDSESQEPASEAPKDKVDPDEWLKDTFGKTEGEMGAKKNQEKASHSEAGENEYRKDEPERQGQEEAA